MDSPIITFVENAIFFTAPLVLAAAGGLTSERSGVMNIALEGKLLGAACVTSLVAGATHNAILGVVGGIFAAVVLSMLHFLLTQTYRIDQVVSGMAVNIVSLGATKFLHERYTNTNSGGAFPMLPSAVYALLAVLIPVALWVYIVRFRGGLRLFAVGNDPEKSRLIGIEPMKIRFMALLATGLFCGLGGAAMVTNSGRFNDGMTAGRGFIALAALILGGWRPVPTLLACLVFGGIDAGQLQLQGTAGILAKLPSGFWNAMPYVLTLIAVATMRSNNRVPRGLGKL